MLDIATLYEQTQLGAELMGFYDDFTASNNFVDTLFEAPNELSYTSSNNINSNSTTTTTNLAVAAAAEQSSSSSSNYNANFLPYNVSYYNCPTDDQLFCLSPGEILLPIDDEDFQCYNPPPKRQKIDYNDLHYSDILFEPACTYQCPGALLFPKADEQIHTPAAVYSIAKKSSSSSSNGGLSAQSVAARQRRRKISEKTQELGKLIPGGNRMNTAEMFHAAYKYIKFLQTQLGLLQLMRSKENSSSLGSEEELEVLLASPTIQDKLYSEEKCLVPQKFVAYLGKHHEIQSNPSFSKEIDLLAGSHEESLLTQATD